MVTKSSKICCSVKTNKNGMQVTDWENLDLFFSTLFRIILAVENSIHHNRKSAENISNQINFINEGIKHFLDLKYFLNDKRYANLVKSRRLSNARIEMD